MLKKICFLALNITSICQATLWKNWAQNQQCSTRLVTPKNTQELITIIKKAHQEKATVHAYGSGHSWSNIVCADYLINTSKLNKIISIDTATNQVTVQAGIPLKHLNAKLAKLGLCLSNQAAITEQSLAGVVATATHGSGKTGTFASFITNVQLLTADGILHNFSATEQSNFFGAARTNIGSLGIMTELTVQCEPLFKVRRNIKTSDWQTVLQEYTTLLYDNDFMQFYWNVHDDSVDIILHHRIPDESNNTFLNSSSYSYQQLSGSRGAIYMEEEIAVPVHRFVEAAQAARLLLEKEYTTSTMFSGILFRFVSAEHNNFLSPAADRDVVFLSITTSSRKGYEPFYKKFYDLMLKYEGRPHWGKINYLTQADAQRLYGKNFDKFIAIRKQLDPHGMFSTECTKQVFGW